MINMPWQLQDPIDAFVFDCDGTLSTIEGIDELAEQNGVGDAVRVLTAEAMGRSGINPDLYQKRLNLVRPSQQQVQSLGQSYITHQIPDISAVIQLLKRFNKTIYIISAGLYPAVASFGAQLQVPAQNIFAVDITFDQQGNYHAFDHTSPLVNVDGKRDVVAQLKMQHTQIAFIGDGLNDYSTYDLVTRFIGYGGVFYRANIAALCQFYISVLSMTPLLALTLTAQECLHLTAEEQRLYAQGLQAIHDGKVSL
jgi:phosphoserine phosphatase